MTRKSTIALGILTIIPFVYFLLFIGFFATVFLTLLRSAGTLDTSPSFSSFAVFFILHFVMIICTLALTIFYMVDVFRNDRVKKDMKVLWAVVIFLGGFVAMPIYWYLYIWSAHKSQPELTPRAAA